MSQLYAKTYDEPEPLEKWKRMQRLAIGSLSHVIPRLGKLGVFSHSRMISQWIYTTSTLGFF
jgi:hypothetical protein